METRPLTSFVSIHQNNMTGGYGRSIEGAIKDFNRLRLIENHNLLMSIDTTIISRLVSVQPMTQPTSLIFYIQNSYGEQKVPLTEDDIIGTRLLDL